MPSPADATGRFDFVLANPPFNVNAVDVANCEVRSPSCEIQAVRQSKFDILHCRRLWIQLFHSALKASAGQATGGRAGFVMANSASDARSSEQELRRQLIESRAVDVMVAVGPNLFYTVTLPCTLWFLDKRKAASPCKPPSPQTSPSGRGSAAAILPSTSGRGAGGEGLVVNVPGNFPGARYSDTVLFIDARHIYRQIDRAHREWTPAQIGFLANLVRLYRGEALDFTLGGEEAKAKILEVFATQPSPQPSLNGRGSAAATLPSTSGRRAGDEGAGKVAYRDIAGLCRAATLKEIEAQGWSLNPGRYVGVAAGEAVSDEDFKEQLETLNEELETLNAAARELEPTIANNVTEILEA